MLWSDELAELDLTGVFKLCTNFERRSTGVNVKARCCCLPADTA